MSRPEAEGFVPFGPGELLRAPLFHAPRNLFREGRLEAFSDGGLLIRAGRLADCGDYAAVRGRNPDAAATGLRGGFILPGFIDTHVHFPRMRVLGALGYLLLEWLELCAFSEEARMADESYARETAGRFVDALLAHGTTMALIFGAHWIGIRAFAAGRLNARGRRGRSGQ